MMKRFFKDMPKDLNTVGTWKMEVYALFPFKDSLVYTETYSGKKWVAYVKVRIKALLKDWSTSGEDYGIAWSLKVAE
ncbi:hypothetical protein CVD28_03120 [Bacillus sp. M6-12]|uniref:hypothetical protein n=1 Tax=Bacillus sp. M6-12 TaxID=2054166 RepID=UPI000C764979|nr:hypothetical protein [Bacillus sp. M6-12]PLS19421.1 hypothetical protein CVD28_03120 [Bacillus sp. M6-12]